MAHKQLFRIVQLSEWAVKPVALSYYHIHSEPTALHNQFFAEGLPTSPLRVETDIWIWSVAHSSEPFNTGGQSRTVNIITQLQHVFRISGLQRIHIPFRLTYQELPQASTINFCPTLSPTTRPKDKIIE